MKTRSRFVGWHVPTPAGATIALVLLAATATGQDAPQTAPAAAQVPRPAGQDAPARQYLAYRTGYKDSSAASHTWGQVMELSANAPPGIELPKFRGKPGFVLWKVRLGTLTGRAGRDGGLWAALDNSADNGPWDTLYLDTDADGSLADETPLRAPWSPAAGGGIDDGACHAVFDMIQVFLPTDDGTFNYHARFQCIRLPDRPAPLLHAIAFCWYEAKVTIGSDEYLCTLLDNNGDGCFGRYHPASTECDRIVLTPTASRRRGAGRDYAFDGYIGRYVHLNGQYYRVDIAPDGSWAAFADVEPEMGTIRGREGVELLAVKGTGGQFYAPEGGGPFRVPAGEKYMALAYRATRFNAQGADWQVSDYGVGRDVPYLVRANETTTVGVARPFVWYVRCAEQEPGLYRILRGTRSIRGDGVHLTGPATDAPRITITSADRAYKMTFIMNADENGAWSLFWRKPDDANGPFTAVCDKQSPFQTIVRPAIIGGPRADHEPAEPLDPNSPDCRTARRQIAAVEAALAAFRKDLGRWPTTDEGLDVLVRKPDGLDGWQGPYVQALPADPWDHPYQYYCPAQGGRDGFDVLSVGPDCTEGTADDIGNRPLLPPPRGTYKPLPLIPATTLLRNNP